MAWYAGCGWVVEVEGAIDVGFRFRFRFCRLLVKQTVDVKNLVR